MSETEIKIPNIGDFRDVEVIEVLVSEGQTIQKNDPLITIESDKSSIEIPSNYEGKIKSLKTKVGDKVSEGDLILIIERKLKEKEINKKPKIEKDFQKIEVIKKDIKNNLLLCRIYFNQGKKEEGNQLIEKFYKENPDNIQIKNFIGIRYLCEGKFEKGWTFYEFRKQNLDDQFPFIKNPYLETR